MNKKLKIAPSVCKQTHLIEVMDVNCNTFCKNEIIIHDPSQPSYFSFKFNNFKIGPSGIVWNCHQIDIVKRDRVPTFKSTNGTTLVHSCYAEKSTNGTTLVHSCYAEKWYWTKKTVQSKFRGKDLWSQALSVAYLAGGGRGGPPRAALSRGRQILLFFFLTWHKYSAFRRYTLQNTVFVYNVRYV